MKNIFLILIAEYDSLLFCWKFAKIFVTCNIYINWFKEDENFEYIGLVESPIQGPKGNREFLIYFKNGKLMHKSIYKNGIKIECKGMCGKE